MPSPAHENRTEDAAKTRAMTQQKIVCIVGTRPEAIKMAPVIRELRERPDQFRCVVVSTGQHRQMLDQVLQLFGICPDIDLGLMQPDQSLSSLTAALFNGLDGVMQQSRPDWVLAQGDTTSVMVASLVAFYQRIKFGHVEAGLRTGDLENPFPEELNRRVADLTTAACFAPTARAASALRAEGISAERIHVTGNTVVDALQQIVASGGLDRVQLPIKLPSGRRMVLVTAHRRESFGDPFRQLCQALRDLAIGHPDVDLVYPVHLNPNVRGPVNEILRDLPNVHLIEPVDYVQLLAMMRSSELILTDSGGIQEEAPTFGVPVLVMRQTTERPEGVEAGVAQLVGTKREHIVWAAGEHLSKAASRVAGANPYGDGQAASRIADILGGWAAS
jgi:UDP-N-acetylglucosamine 2-epimerase (non-hydrolysing)